MFTEAMVGNVKGVIVLDNEGRRIIAKYYNHDQSPGLENLNLQKVFERSLFTKSNKQEGSSSGTGGNQKLNIYENDIMNVDDYVAVFRCYQDMTIYVLGDAKNDNELILATVLNTIHDCFDTIFKHNVERKNLINNMTGVILVIDELIDQGIIMQLDSTVILQRISSKGDAISGGEQAAASTGGGFMSMFGSG